MTPQEQDALARTRFHEAMMEARSAPRADISRVYNAWADKLTVEHDARTLRRLARFHASCGAR